MTTVRLGILRLILALVLIPTLSACDSGAASQAGSTQNDVSEEMKKRFAVDAAEEGLKQRMKDPESMQTRNVVAYKQGNGGYIVCGEVNAKNSFGGYNGFEPFMGAGDMVYTASDNEAVGDFNKLYDMGCRANATSGANKPRKGSRRKPVK
jgi:hypothetical protein